MNTHNEKKFFPALTGIRAICAYFIFLRHLNPFSPGSTAFLATNQLFPFLSFFFVVSGFVICHRYYSVGTLNKRKLWNYFMNRISRLFPILIILVSATFLLQYIKHTDTTGNILKNWVYSISLLKGFSSNHYLTGIGPSWSLSVEELFYLMSPLVFFLIKKPSGLIKFVLLMYTIGVVITLFFIKFPVDGFFSNLKFTSFTTFFGRVFEFTCGIYLALITRKKFNDNILRKIPFPTLTGVILFMMVLVGSCFVAYHYQVTNAVETWPGLILNNLISPIPVTLIFYGLLNRPSTFERFLSLKPVVALGNSTYSFYLIHTSFILSWITAYVSGNILVCWIIMVIFSYVFYMAIEQPIAKWLRQKLTIR